MAKKKEKEVVETAAVIEVVEEVQEEIVDESTAEEAPVEATEVVRLPDGRPVYTKAQFAEIIETYKMQNPAKYELKKEALAETLKSLK